MDRAMTANNARTQRIRGTLLGLAWGDALGCPVEYWSHEQITQVHGQYRDLPTTYPFERLPNTQRIWEHLRPLGLHSDDTQQALALLQVCLADGGFTIESWADCLVEGHRTRAWRGTGRNFRTAVEQLLSGAAPQRAGSPSAGLGGAMRIGPIGALYRDDPERLRDVVLTATWCTHADLRAVSLAYAVAAACRALVLGADVQTVAAQLPELVATFEDYADHLGFGGTCGGEPAGMVEPLREALAGDFRHPAELRQWLKARARSWLKDASDLSDVPSHAFAPIGGLHALAMGLWRGPEVEPQALLADTIAQGGDADTVGAITGALLGARFGAAWIPTRRLWDTIALEAYASALTSGELPEARTAFLAREAGYTLSDRRFRDEAAARRPGVE